MKILLIACDILILYKYTFKEYNNFSFGRVRSAWYVITATSTLFNAVIAGAVTEVGWLVVRSFVQMMT
jgi:hypothetical protein